MRTREVRAVQELMGDIKGHDLLDLGCGAGYYTRLLLGKGASHVTAVDFSDRMVAQLPTEYTTGVVADATNVQFNRTFSRIICAGLLEFVDDPAAVLSNALGLISPGGHLVCLIPPNNWASRIYRLFHQQHGFNINLFRDSGFKDLCDNSGWAINATRRVFPYTVVHQLVPK
jgi:2-polyprenyl-3-methyl-5-hydroxy-6-metoxy-1,4-benzoquinol methylase